MKTYQVTLVYTAYAHYDFVAESEDAAEAMAWADFEQSPADLTYGEWETASVEEVPNYETATDETRSFGPRGNK
jgi:hypothetical protein